MAEEVSSSLPERGQQESKRQKKMSSTDDEEKTMAVDGEGIPRKPKYKRRKVAILFAYCGVGYQGMQKNPGAKTIEGDMEEALHRSGAVPEPERGLRTDWARSARTDKGVSAVGQVVSGWFYVDPPGFIDRLNSNLAPQIRAFGYRRVTPSFSAKKFCDRRRYVYLIPVFALDPSRHRDRESVFASLGSENQLVKCSECSERGRKVFGVMGKQRPFDSVTTAEEEEVPSDISSNTQHALLTCSDHEKNSNEAFSYGDEIKERFNRILESYQGTHNFHNFTTRTKAQDPSAKRYIISFTANSVIPIDGIDFINCVVVGQSFMLHQIRKMIGLAVAIMRNTAPESLMETAFQEKVNMNVPMAPEVGLYLDECFFPSYNEKWRDTHEEVSMEGFEDEAEEFKVKFIYPHVAATEHRDGVVALWLHSLNHRNYPDLLLKDP
ncbi:hypothetical protein M569_08012 [Genlisea aurea]|uniref:Pseudouridine synthase I TruA alpha/beta domain-containing protein n=1 Tax=Genlisea aurea TaxID=192259 RepID=S8DU75_9LAMI|nr:hypothetical protein M569_08012 [Genlisea aurea]